MITIGKLNDCMDVRDLQIFLSAAKHLNYTRAGEEINLSQPSVSVRIQRLEHDLGTKLFEQLGKKIALTEAGHLFVPFANRVIGMMNDARDAIAELQGLERGSLRIGASTTPGMYVIPRAIAEFKQLHPKIQTHLSVKDTRQIEEGILKNEYDLGFVGGHLVGDDLEVEQWMTDDLILIVPLGHRLTTKSTITPRDLASEKFIIREQGSATRMVVSTHFKRCGITSDAVMEMTNPESIKKAVQNGLGVAFISAFAVETELQAKILVAVKVKNLEIHRQLKIVYRKDKHLSRTAQTFIEVERN